MSRWCVVLSLAVLLSCWWSAVRAQPAQDDANQATPTDPTATADDPSSDVPPANAAASAANAADGDNDAPRVAYPLIVLVIGVAIVLGLIIGLKINAFIALITAAVVVSLMAPGDVAGKIGRVATAFGAAAGGIGIVIAMAAVIGKCMLDSGAADRIVRAFLRLLGEDRAPVALMGSGFILAVPVFFDTVFYLLVPLARSLHRKTARQYLKYILAIAAGGAITHTLVPPTPGPLLMADNLGIDVGMLIMVGSIVALPAAIAGLIFAGLADRWMPIPMRSLGGEPEPEPLTDDQLPSLWLSLAPVVLPVVLISTSTILTTWADGEHAALLNEESIAAEDWDDWRRLVREQADASPDSVGARILNHPDIQPHRELWMQADRLDASQQALLRDDVNRMLGRKDFYCEADFQQVTLNPVAKQMLGKLGVRMKKAEAERLNRALLESAYPMIRMHQWDTLRRKAANYGDLFGNANLALLLSAVIAIATLATQRGLSLAQLAHAVEVSLMSGGVIILITSAGGAFGKMLEEAQVGPAVQALFAGSGSGGLSGLGLLILGFGIAAVLKIAQGSSTVAMIVGSGMVAAIIADQKPPFHLVYLATAIGAGSLVGSWMNDSGFWIFAKMGGLTEVEALKSWTIMLIVLALVSFGVTVALAMTFPMLSAG